MPKKILIIDDEPNIVKLLEARLKAAGYETVVAYDGQEGLDKVEQEKPDLIILDITMPKLDGYEICRRLSVDERYKHIPIVMLTARGEARDIKMGMELGSVSYIAKPFKSDVLLAILQGLLRE